jgi:hypothetical protein
MDEGRFGHDLERSGRGLMEVLSPHFPGRIEKNHEKYNLI